VLIERLDGQVRLLEGGKRTEDPGAVTRWLGGWMRPCFERSSPSGMRT